MSSVVRYRDLWRANRDFRMFFCGQLVSFLGDWFTTIALYSAVAEFTSSALALTLVLVCKTSPIFLIAPIAGPIVDRVDRRRLLIATDTTRGFLALLFIALHQLGSLPAIYACAIASTLVAGIAIPAKQAVLPRIVSAQAYAVANAMGGASWAGMLTLGAAVGGTATAVLGIDASFVIDACTFGVSAAFFYRLPSQRPPTDKSDNTGFVEALRYLLRNPALAAQASIKTCQCLAGGVFALIPLFGGGLYEGHEGAWWLGMLYAIRGLGTLVGTLWFRVLVRDRHSTMRLSLIGAFAGQVVAYWLLAHATSFTAACVYYSLSGLLQGLVWVFAGTLLQAGVDPRYHGRVFAMEFGGLTLALAISSSLAGFFVDAGIPPQGAILMMAPLPLVGVLVALYVYLAER
ncbi:MAG: MFS transporter [Myxococcales bacterium]|nr:MFS transporter [Myxococcales bacterium]